jgi:hypothetical protein
VFTHFVSLPLAIYPDLTKNIEAFQNSVLGNNDKDPLKFQSTLAGKITNQIKKCFKCRTCFYDMFLDIGQKWE